MKQTVIDALRNRHTQAINFSFAGSAGANIRIVPNDFLRVAEAIEQNVINVAEGGVADGMAKYTASDDGASRANTMYVGRNTTSASVLDSLLVHESVHAVFDLRKISIPWLDNETAAYIAQGFYIKSAGEDAGLSQEAFLGLEIAKTFAANGTDPFWLDELRNSLLNNPTYHDYIRGTFVGDG
jgi:hypothetical protein